MTSLTAVQLLSSALPILTIPYLTHALRNEGFGAVVLGLAFSQLAAVYLDLDSTSRLLEM